ncbi:M20 metallopeptidase family protein [Paenibacillus koleovorans]|uniref:M20 metallopeptidase family protein n=1 Tax=Paenibacillus koleovorans TaxID=121608 RepID=UPI000FD7A2E7|nr:M20 family metallopeptidase [Paenibacillus koleovorans]
MIEPLSQDPMFAEELVRWRRELHRHPELGLEEWRTSAFLEERLREIGVDEIATLAGTGKVALLRGAAEGPTVMLRADMDGLPIGDGKSVEYASSIPNRGHLCGHDAHMTMLLGAARLLKRRGIPRGNVKLVFQPAEEILKGAKAMIEDGVLERPKVDAAYGLHVVPARPIGQIAVCPGQAYAYTDGMIITIDGKAAHAAYPNLGIDTIAIAAQVITGLQQVVSRMTSPLVSAVVTIGKINGGVARNVIAPQVVLEGTVRTLDATVREQVHAAIEQIVAGICEAYGARSQVEIIGGSPPVHNDEALLPYLRAAVDSAPSKPALNLVGPTMGGEDFAFYSQQVPSLFFWLGVGNERKGIVHGLHHPLFDLDEDALPLGAGLLADTALNYLQGC